MPYQPGGGRRPVPAHPTPAAGSHLYGKSCAALSAFFGVVYAGGFYSYFNPELPAARLQQIQSVLGASCVITDQAHRSVMEEIFPASSILLVEELMISQEDQSQLAAIRAAMIDTDPSMSTLPPAPRGCPKECW